MKYIDTLGIIPPQYTGTALETEAVVELADETAAKVFFSNR